MWSQERELIFLNPDFFIGKLEIALVFTTSRGVRIKEMNPYGLFHRVLSPQHVLAFIMMMVQFADEPYGVFFSSQ